MRILVVSQETWRDDTSGGNVLSNIFRGFEAEFAQIYCSPGAPSNDICDKYFQMTDVMVLRALLQNRPIGESFHLSDRNGAPNHANLARTPMSAIYRISRILRGQILYSIRELVWSRSHWQSSALEDFVRRFDPDIVFAPCYGSRFMLSLDRHVIDLVDKPSISYISDDHYSLWQFRLSPLFWLERLWLRSALRRTFPYFQLTYTMTDDQSSEMAHALGARMAILRKGAVMAERSSVPGSNTPIRLIYAGGVYLNRWRTLCAVADAIRSINADGIRMTLDVFTRDELTKEQRSHLDDGQSSFVRGLANSEQLRSAYQSSDIALHVESFDLRNRLATRLSFSTKIVDCLGSGCAVMVITWSGHAGYRYLSKEDAAICIGDPKNIEGELRGILQDPSIIDDYAARASNCLARNHNPDDIRQMLVRDFERVARLGN